MNLTLSIERRAVLDLVPYEKNSKNHGEEDVAALARSIERFGFNDPIAITPEGIIIEGHGRLMAVTRLGWDDVPVLVIDGMTEEQYDLYRIGHNKLAQTSQFNFSRLFDTLQELVGEGSMQFADMGFNDRAVHDLFAHFGDHESETAGAPSSSVGASTAPIEYNVIWDDKEAKVRFTKFLSDAVSAGGDKSLGGELLMAAVAERDPELWAQIIEACPGETNLDQVAGTTAMETLHVTH